jgi:hypothetical protein
MNSKCAHNKQSSSKLPLLVGGMRARSQLFIDLLLLLVLARLRAIAMLSLLSRDHFAGLFVGNRCK